MRWHQFARYWSWTLHQPKTQNPISVGEEALNPRSYAGSKLRLNQWLTGESYYMVQLKIKFSPSRAYFRGPWLTQRKFFIENTTFILICYQVHNDSWKYTYHYKSHSWKQPCLYILLGSIQNEKIDTLLNKWYKKILYVERFNFLLTNLHFLVTA